MTIRIRVWPAGAEGPDNERTRPLPDEYGPAEAAAAFAAFVRAAARRGVAGRIALCDDTGTPLRLAYLPPWTPGWPDLPSVGPPAAAAAPAGCSNHPPVDPSMIQADPSCFTRLKCPETQAGRGIPGTDPS